MLVRLLAVTSLPTEASFFFSVLSLVKNGRPDQCKQVLSCLGSTAMATADTGAPLMHSHGRYLGRSVDNPVYLRPCMLHFYTFCGFAQQAL